MAVDEGVNAIGLSILSGSHKELVPDVMDKLRAAGLADVAVFVGGTIPLEDQPYLKEIGVTDIFTADMSLEDVVSSIARTLA